MLYQGIIDLKRHGIFLGLCLSAAVAWSGVIDPDNKNAWPENTGWQNWRATHGEALVHVTGSGGYMSGYVWAENIGWIKLGAGTGPYANTSSGNYGVNMDASGNLTGYAWSENAGWINFNPSHSQVKIDMETGSFYGYAWGENIGWINFKNISPAYNVRVLLEPPPQPPAAPTGVSASAGTYDYKVWVTWNAAAGATSYKLYRSALNDSGTASLLATTTANSHADTTAVAGQTHYYWVKAANAAGAGGFSAGANGWRGVMGPVVAVNGLVGDNVRIPAVTPLMITVELMNIPAAYLGVEVDYWVAAYAHGGGLWYYLSDTMAWTPFDGSLENIRPVYQGPLMNLPPVKVAEGLRLGPGVYNIWFVVDYPMDGILHMTAGAHLLSQVTLTVE